MVVLPLPSMAKTVVVALAVDEEMLKSGVEPREVPAMERRAKGVVVPRPSEVPLKMKVEEVEMVLAAEV